jgi:Cdc6-like AAA superfamily ATPase
MNPLELINLYATPITANDKNDAIALEVATNFSLRKTLLTHSRFKQAITQIAELHQHSKSNNVGGGLLVTGPSGVGKTTILQHYLEHFPRIKAQQKTIIPVLHVVTPASPTVKSFAEAILLALGDPMAQRGSAEQKTFRIYQLLEACEVEILLIDEIQHFYYAHSIVEFRRILEMKW